MTPTPKPAAEAIPTSDGPIDDDATDIASIRRRHGEDSAIDCWTRDTQAHADRAALLSHVATLTARLAEAHTLAAALFNADPVDIDGRANLLGDLCEKLGVLDCDGGCAPTEDVGRAAGVTRYRRTHRKGCPAGGADAEHCGSPCTCGARSPEEGPGQW